MHYVCEKGDFRSGKIILQQPVERAQMQKLLASGKTDLLDKFISRKNRPFKAFLVVKEGKVGFEFEERKGRAGKPRAEKVPPVKIDFSTLESIGKCPRCGGKVCEAEAAYLCERTQADSKPCKIKINKVIAQQPIDRAQALKLLTDGRTDVLDKFISRAGRPFKACLVMDNKGKVTFEFPDS
jgi:DNA topoisomerase-3